MLTAEDLRDTRYTELLKTALSTVGKFHAGQPEKKFNLM